MGLSFRVKIRFTDSVQSNAKDEKNQIPLKVAAHHHFIHATFGINAAFIQSGLLRQEKNHSPINGFSVRFSFS